MSLQPHEIKSTEQLINYLVDSTQEVICVPRVLLIKTLREDAQELLPTLPEHIFVNRKRAVELCQKSHPQLTPSKITTTS